MAITTLSGAAGGQPRAIHVGETLYVREWSLTAVASAGDVFRVCKVPVGVVLTSCVVDAGGGAGNSFPLTIAVGAQTIASLTVAAGLTDLGANLPLNISISDDVITRFALATVTVGTITSATATGHIALKLGWLKGEEGLQA